jgi:hypothetical protein
MSLARATLDIACVEVGSSAPDDKARIRAMDRLRALLSVLDSKTSVLLRFNAIVVAALAYLVVVRSADPFAESAAVVKAIGFVIGHVSLLLSVVSCGFAFPVINVEPDFFGRKLDRIADGVLGFDDAALERLANLVAHRTWLYSRAWQLAVAGGTGFAILVALATIH